MSEKRFEVDVDHLLLVWDTEKNKRLEIEDIVVLLNEQQDIISQLQDLCGKSDYENAKLRLKNKELQEENEKLRQQLKEKEEDEQLYANEIVKLNKEAKEVLDFKSLGGDY